MSDHGIIELPLDISDESLSLKRKAPSVDTDDASTTTSRKTRKRIPSDQWEIQRPIITRLYQVEKRSLREVMDTMEKEYGFTATVKMYKSRIWKWGLDKKLKSDEVLAILLLKQERDAQRKPTQYTIRGQPVDLDNINRYVKRSPGLVARFRAGHAPSIQTSHEVSCFTPPPSPGRSLPPPVETHRVDEMLHLFRDYVDGSFSSLAWDWQYDVYCSGRVSGDRSEDLVESVLGSFALSNRCLARGDKISIENLLQPAFESLKELVAAQSPVFVVRAVSILWYLESHQKADLLHIVVSYLARIVPIMLGQHHVLSRIWQTLGSNHFPDYSELATCLYSMLVPMMEERIGPANYLTTLLYGDQIDCLIQRGLSSDAALLAGRYCSKVDATGQRHPWLSELAITQTAILCAQKESEGLVSEAIDLLHSLKAYPMSEEQLAMIETQMGNYTYRLGDYRGAISAYRRAAQLALSAGADERLFTTCLTNLEIALKKQGQACEATRDAKYPHVPPQPIAAVTCAPAYCSVSLTSEYDIGFIMDDSSWLWQDSAILGSSSANFYCNAFAGGGASNDLLKDLHLAPVDPSTRFMGHSSVSDSWERSTLLGKTSTPIPSTRYLSMEPLATHVWPTDVFR